MKYYRVYFPLDVKKGKELMRIEPKFRENEVKVWRDINILYSKSFFSPPLETDGPLMPVVVVESEQPQVLGYPSPSDVLRNSNYGKCILDSLVSYDNYKGNKNKVHYINILRDMDRLEKIKEIHGLLVKNCGNVKIYHGKYPDLAEADLKQGGGVVVFARGKREELHVHEATFVSEETFFDFSK
jgi:hypothetical protein